MKKLVILISLAFIANACTEEKPAERPVRKTSKIVLESNLDPICKMDVQINRTDTLLYQGKIYGFCSPVCKEQFIEKMKKN